MFKVKRALLSVSDKHGLVEFARGLDALGVEILSTGGTCRAIREAGINAIEVSDRTGFPEIMDGRVKTLHPVIHGGPLGRRGTDEDVMAEHGIDPIDLLVVNLYPFEATIEKPDVTLEDAIENIDIGGPAMIRAASKNHVSVGVVVDPSDYDDVLAALRAGSMSDEYRRGLASKAYAHTSVYDAAISTYLADPAQHGDPGKRFFHAGSRIAALRYGENPHQGATFYADRSPPGDSLAAATQVQGKELSYNNIADADAALECVRQFETPACVIVKHANPCGVAINDSIAEAYDRAYQTDPTSAFGGIIAFNRPVDGDTARKILDRQFVEVIVAPAFDEEARAVLAEERSRPGDRPCGVR